MNKIQLSAQDIANVAAYFASQPWPSTTPPANVSYTSTLKQLAEAKVINLKARQDARSNDPLNAAYGSRRGDRIATHDDCPGEMSAMTKCGHWVEKR